MKRLNVHTEFDCLTLLFRDDCGSLEVWMVGGRERRMWSRLGVRWLWVLGMC